MQYCARFGNLRDGEGRLRTSNSLSDFLKWAMLSEGAKVLDAGCGAGRNYIALCELGMRAYGIDLRQEAIDMARDETRKEGVPARIVHGDLRFLPFPYGFFDAVFANAVPAVVTAYAWENALRCMKIGGRGFFRLIQRREYNDARYKNGDWFVDAGEVRKWFEYPGYKVEFDRAERREVCREKGLETLHLITLRAERLE